VLLVPSAFVDEPLPPALIGDAQVVDPTVAVNRAVDRSVVVITPAGSAAGIAFAVTGEGLRSSRMEEIGAG